MYKYFVLVCTDKFKVVDLAQVPINRLVDKKVVCIYNRILLGHKKEWNLSICDNMDGPVGYYTKWSKSEKDKYHRFHLYVKSKEQNKWTK